MFEPKAHIGVVFKGFFPRRFPVGGFEGNHLVAVDLGDLYPAIPLPVLHIGSVVDDEPGLELFDI